jgi:hypothetical protein
MNEYRVYVELDPVDGARTIDTWVRNEQAMSREQAVYQAFDHLADNFSHRTILGISRVEMKAYPGEWVETRTHVHVH